MNEVLREMVPSHENGSNEGTNESHPEIQDTPPRGISGVLRGLVELISDGKKTHIVDAVKNELQHIAEDGELLDRADGEVIQFFYTFSFLSRRLFF